MEKIAYYCKVDFGFMRKTIFLSLMFLTLYSCGSLKRSFSPSEVGDYSTKTVSKKNRETTPDHEYVLSRATVGYKSPNKTLNLSAKIRMQQDSIIWISASVLGLQVAKIIMTPTQIKFYEKLGKSYYSGDYQALENILGIRVGFYEVQRILTGMPVQDLSETKLDQVADSTSYKLRANSGLDDYDLVYLLNAISFRLEKSEIIDNKSEKILANISYKDSIKVNNSSWPASIILTTYDRKNVIRLNLDYKRIEERKSLSFPYKVPARYTEFSF